MKMFATAEEKDGKLYVTAQTTLTYGKKLHTYKNWKTSDVIEYIKEHYPQYQIESVVSGAAFISNYRPKYLKGEWIFALEKPPEAPPKQAPPAFEEKRPAKAAVPPLTRERPSFQEEPSKIKRLRRKKRRPRPDTTTEDK